MSEKVDVSKLREGDVVLVRVTFKGGPDRDGDFRIGTGSGAVLNQFCKADDIVSVEPRPLKVGDRVRWQNSPHIYELRAIDDDAGLVRDGSTVWGVMLSTLERAS